MTLEDVKEVVRGYMEEILNQGNFERYDAFFPREFWFNGRILDRIGLMRVRVSFAEAFPDFHMTIEDQIVEGDRVATRVTITGTHQGEFRGVPATDRAVAYAGIAIDRIVDGKVREMWHVSSDLAALLQIGAVIRGP